MSETATGKRMLPLPTACSCTRHLSSSPQMTLCIGLFELFVMCGIGALLQPRAHCGTGSAMRDEHLHLLARRGPDVQRTLQLPVYLHNVDIGGSLILHGSVLSMRGVSPLVQPLQSDRYSCETPALA